MSTLEGSGCHKLSGNVGIWFLKPGPRRRLRLQADLEVSGLLMFSVENGALERGLVWLALCSGNEGANRARLCARGSAEDKGWGCTSSRLPHGRERDCSGKKKINGLCATSQGSEELGSRTVWRQGWGLSVFQRYF